MTIARNLLAELKQEAIATRKMLELVPFDKSDWKPHSKSMTLGRLASHVAELPFWIELTIKKDELDFKKFDYKPFVPESNADLLAFFDKNLILASDALEKCSDEDMMKDWSLRSGDEIYFTLPKAAVMRSMNMNHMIHHRGQLSVFMRLLDIPLPGVYGPTADNPM
jgi:uncharacterized damage-inducible protein DinB